MTKQQKPKKLKDKEDERKYLNACHMSTINAGNDIEGLRVTFDPDILTKREKKEVRDSALKGSRIVKYQKLEKAIDGFQKVEYECMFSNETYPTNSFK